MAKPGRCEVRRWLHQRWPPLSAAGSRRTFNRSLAILAVGGPFTTSAKGPSTLRRIGFLSVGGEQWKSVVGALRELGWVEGGNLHVELRHANRKLEALPALAEELVRADVQVIVADGPNPTIAAKRATTTIPIVFFANDAVLSGLVSSLARPGGNATGFSPSGVELDVKCVALLKEAKPSLRRVCVLEVPANPQYRLRRPAFGERCRSIGIAPVYVQVGSAADIDAAIEEATREHAEALVLLHDSFMSAHRAKVISAALRAGMATVASSAEFARDGALASYSPRQGEEVGRLAYYVDRILRGAKPAELPVEEPTRFELVINLKTAGTLGIKIPRSLLVQASELIQ